MSSLGSAFDKSAPRFRVPGNILSTIESNRHNDPVLYTALFKHKVVRVFTDAWEQRSFRSSRSKSATRLRMTTSAHDEIPNIDRRTPTPYLETPELVHKAISLSPRSASRRSPVHSYRPSLTTSPCFQNCVQCEGEDMTSTAERMIPVIYRQILSPF